MTHVLLQDTLLAQGAQSDSNMHAQEDPLISVEKVMKPTFTFTSLFFF